MLFTAHPARTSRTARPDPVRAPFAVTRHAANGTRTIRATTHSPPQDHDPARWDHARRAPTSGHEHTLVVTYRQDKITERQRSQSLPRTQT
ncbi:hypothetical protein FrCorBMG51_15970 [Protofrankia coriariae]|uniref:Uncharacterized protein n=1 Tax=Protofrankia coriariae TaxID=1562887 RepID=A0ABR5F296_9ACTN|nr:hypothetical protein FrCorBMG51_15970 [Protofrankia coriariae]